MEFELDRIQMNSFRVVLDAGLRQEETLEMIVPDACPDILRVVETDGKAILAGKTAEDGRVQLSGLMKLHVLYLPDGEEGVRELSAGIPFTCTFEERGVGPSCAVVAGLRLCRADTRALNPRKVLIRAEAAAEVTVYAPCADLIAAQVLSEAGEEVQQLIEPREVYVTAAVQEKPFAIREEVPLPTGRPAAAELLKSRADLGRREAKIIGNKLVLKGETGLELVCRGTDGSLYTARAELPLTQIIEIPDLEEEADCDCTLVLTGMECALVPAGDGRTVEVSIEGLTQAVVRQQRTLKVLTDAYSTAVPSECRWDRIPTDRKVDRGIYTQAVRESWEPPAPIREILECRLMTGPVIQSREGDRLVLTAQAEVCCLAVEEGGEVIAFRHPVAVPWTADLPEGCTCLCRCEKAGEVYAAPSPDGVEARFSLDFRICALCRGTIQAVAALTPAEETGDKGEPPSLVLRMCGQGERLWDMAKGCGTTIADIISANELGDEAEAAGRLLLIPRKR